uniref:Uncharacterized protein n=1 Tax=Pristionchus pacificus TaxID=54126 RepID=A0A2A6BSL4_PRIPA|eukprot:PDM68865.1 hypothetical protein PRIPAC_47167 [Pristionchus pacificus]
MGRDRAGSDLVRTNNDNYKTTSKLLLFLILSDEIEEGTNEGEVRGSVEGKVTDFLFLHKIWTIVSDEMGDAATAAVAIGGTGEESLEEWEEKEGRIGVGATARGGEEGERLRRGINPFLIKYLLCPRYIA